MIIVIGEALIDLIEDKQNKGQFQAIVGGANCNVALALARRESKHQFLARISTDRFGSIIKQRLIDNKVSFDQSITTAEPTTLAVVSVDDSGKPQYNFYTEGTADWGWTREDLPTRGQLKAMNATAIQFGCLTMAIEPGNKVVEAWAKELQNDLTISHDINVRPALGFDRAEQRARVERINSFSHIIKASDEDIEWLYDLAPETDPTEIIQTWINNSNKLVLLTKGSKGTRIYRNNETIEVPARQTTVVDTVGAGDTFIAHLIAQLDENNHLGSNPLTNLSNTDLTEYVRIASIGASLACEKSGCEPPTVTAFSNYGQIY